MSSFPRDVIKLAATILVACTVLQLSAVPTTAAEIKPVTSSACKLALEGPIQLGDADKLAAALLAIPEGDNVAICLSSPGGNYEEGLKMILLVLKRTNVATVVDRGAECYSACAFLFLAGNSQRSEDGELGPDRTLDVRGTLGFHAPYLKGTEASTDSAATAETYRQGVNAIARMLEIDRRELFPRGLLAKALQVGPNYLLFIDTIEKAGVWSIKLKGYRPLRFLSDAMLDQACRNKDIWTNFAHSFLGRQPGDADEQHGIRQSDFPDIRGTAEPIHLAGHKYRKILDLFGFEATNVCVVDVYEDNEKKPHLSLAMIAADAKPADPAQFVEAVTARSNDDASMEMITDPLWYVFAPNTTLKSIAAQ